MYNYNFESPENKQYFPKTQITNHTHFLLTLRNELLLMNNEK